MTKPSLSLAQLCGQLLIVGFEGPTLPSELAHVLARGERAGVILFRRNLASILDTKRLCDSVHSLGSEACPAVIGIDEEGGRVARLPAPAFVLPAMQQLAAQGGPDACERIGALVGRELASLGVTLNFAPVVDIDSNPQNPVIGDRAFGKTAPAVIEAAGAYLRGLLGQGVMGCLKHYPGHGDTTLDSHTDLPVVATDLATLEARELAPFRALLPHCPTVMSAHLVASAMDSEPATLSHRWMTEYLRGSLGFLGAAISDDLEMGALSNSMSVEASAVGAIEAGCDWVLICHSAEKQELAHQALIREAERSPAFRSRCEQAVERTFRLRHSFPRRSDLEIADAFAHSEQLQAWLAALRDSAVAPRL